MVTTYEIWHGQRLLSLQSTSSAREAVIGYLRSEGCDDNDVMRVGVDAATWRGSLYRAVALGSGRDA
jgi:hypothetical protein